MHAVSLYADLLLHLRDLHNIPATIAETLQKFEMISGLRVNWANSCLHPFRGETPNPNLSINNFPLHWQPSTFRYLGIFVYRDPADILEGNLTRAISAIRSQVKFWKTLPLNVMARIALTKMVMLPKLLYYSNN